MIERENLDMDQTRSDVASHGARAVVLTANQGIVAVDVTDLASKAMKKNMRIGPIQATRLMITTIVLLETLPCETLMVVGGARAPSLPPQD
jgi:hypothetical protein